ncbi:MAG: hypothetical protein EXR79_00115 [Myxococcales bacterium]|nr:hypothetical protein [Myxococcales bacterium]
MSNIAACTLGGVVVARRRSVSSGWWCAAVLFVGSCSEPPADADKTAAAVDPAQLVLRTDVGTGSAWAGVWTAVACRTFRKPPVGAPADTLGSEVPLPAGATLTVDAGASMGAVLQIAGTRIAFAQAGTHRVRCVVPPGGGGGAKGLADEIGNLIEVAPAPAAVVDTVLIGPAAAIDDPHHVAAGTAVEVACGALDPWGNPVALGLELVGVAGAGGLDAGNGGHFTLHLEKVGTWKPTCRVFQPAGLHAAWAKADHIDPQALQHHLDIATDASPPSLTVVVGPPRHLTTLFDPPQVQAGHAATLQCQATDAFGNPVPDFPFTLDHAKPLQVTGIFVSTTQAGLWKVQCVPEADAWDLYVLHPATLHVVPAPAATLAVQPLPAKSVYKREEKVQFLATIHDAFGNVRPDDVVEFGVKEPKVGWVAVAAQQFQFNADGKYLVAAHVSQAPAVAASVTLVVDGAPPLLTLDVPGWGSTRTGKPSVLVQGTVGDAVAGLKSLKVNGKAAYSDLEGAWSSQQPAAHGLTMFEAVAEDLGGEMARATRGFYWSTQWYATKLETPHAAMVPHGIQVLLGKDFFDDGVHDPAKPDDLATMMELVLAGMDPATLLPGAQQANGADIKVSNVKFGPPKVTLVPTAAGLVTTISIPDIQSDVDVHATQKLGPIKVKVHVTGTVKIAKLTVKTTVGIDIEGGKAQTGVGDTTATVDGLQVNLDGLAGLFDSVVNAIVDGYKGKLQSEVILAVEKTLPALLAGLTKQLAIQQTIDVPPVLPGLPKVAVQLVTVVDALHFSPAGMALQLDASFVAPKATPHVTLGAMGRGECPGQPPAELAVDPKQRIQLAMHDDVLNQALHAAWLAGGMKAKGLKAKDLGLKVDPKDVTAAPLNDAVFALDLFLPPVLESCSAPTGDVVKVQIGDAYSEATLPLGDGLTIGLLAQAEVTAKLGLGVGKLGAALTITPTGGPKALLEMVSITKEFENMKPSLEKLVLAELDKTLKKGLPGLDELKLDLPATDIAALLPGMPAGAKMSVHIVALQRAGGYTVLTAAFQ